MILLSILTPFVRTRLDKLGDLMEYIEDQIGDLPVEHLTFGDNKKRTIGAKRNALLDIAQGKYIAFVDDDDWVKPHYVRTIVEAIEAHSPDVLTFEQDAYFDGVHGLVEWRHGQQNEQFNPETITLRGAWHPCVWKADIARSSRFSETNYGEDWAWAEPLNGIHLVEHHIPEPLHEYHFSTEGSEAHP